MRDTKHPIPLFSTLLRCAALVFVLGGAIHGFADSRPPTTPECRKPEVRLDAAGLRLSYAVSESTSWELIGPDGVMKSGKRKRTAKTLNSVPPGNYTLTARHRISVTPTVFDQSGKGEKGEEQVLCEEVATAGPVTAACPRGSIAVQEDALVWQASSQGASLAAAEVHGPDEGVIVASPLSDNYQGTVHKPTPGLYTLAVTAPDCSKQQETIEVEEPEEQEPAPL